MPSFSTRGPFGGPPFPHLWLVTTRNMLFCCPRRRCRLCIDVNNDIKRLLCVKSIKNNQASIVYKTVGIFKPLCKDGVEGFAYFSIAQIK